MQFKHPEILYLLLLIIVPIIIHLFHLQRFTKQPFSNVQFLKKIELKTRKSSRLKKWLILSARSLAFTCLILAFSQPFFSDQKNDSSTHTLIYLDNSLSMSYKENKQEILKKSAQEIIYNLPQNTKISFLTNDKTYKNIDQKTLKNILKSIDYSSYSLNLNTITSKINQINNNESITSNKVIIISDFQNIKKNKNISVTNVNTPVSLLNVASNQFSNSYIDSAYISNRNSQEITLNIILKNISSRDKNFSISLFDDEKLIGKTTTHFQKNIDNEVEFKFPTKNKFNGIITINEENLTFDNRLYFTLSKPKKTRVLSIGKPSTFLYKIYTKNEFDFTQEKLDKIDLNKISNKHLIILNEIEQISNQLQHRISQFVKKGGVIAIIPPEKIDLKSYNQLFLNLNLGKISDIPNKKTLKITTINYDHPLLKDVFEREIYNFEYPTTNNHYKVDLINSSKIVSFEDQTGFVNQMTSKLGTVFWFQTPLNLQNSNFQHSPLIVPIFYNIGAFCYELPKLYYSIDQENTIEIATKLNKNEILKFDSDSSSESFIPLQQVLESKVKITLQNNPKSSGFFNIKNGEKTIETIAFNENRRESNSNYPNIEELFKNNKNINISYSIEKTFKNLNNQQQIKSLFKWFLTLTILFLLLEICILKFYRA